MTEPEPEQEEHFVDVCYRVAGEFVGQPAASADPDPAPPGADNAAGPADAEPAPPPPQPAQEDAGEDEDDPSQDYHPFVIEVRKRVDNIDRHDINECIVRHDIEACICRATDEEAKSFCRTYGMRPSASFNCRDDFPYTKMIAMTMACEVQYRMQFFFDMACWRGRDPTERPYRFGSHELNWCEPSTAILRIYNQADEDSRLRKRIDKILDIHPVNP